MFFLLQGASPFDWSSLGEDGLPKQLGQVSSYISYFYAPPLHRGGVDYSLLMKDLSKSFPDLSWPGSESMKALRHIFENAQGEFCFRPTSELIELIYSATDDTGEYKILLGSICRALDVTTVSHGDYNPGYKAFLLKKFLDKGGIDMHELDFQVACMYCATWSGDLANIRDNADFIADLIIHAPINYDDPYHGHNFFYSHVMNPLPPEVYKAYEGGHNFFERLNNEEKAQEVREKMHEWRLYAST